MKIANNFTLVIRCVKPNSSFFFAGFQVNNVATQNVNNELFRAMTDALIANEKYDGEIVKQYRSKKFVADPKCEIPFLLRNKIGQKRIHIPGDICTKPYGYRN